MLARASRGMVSLVVYFALGVLDFRPGSHRATKSPILLVFCAAFVFAKKAISPSRATKGVYSPPPAPPLPRPLFCCASGAISNRKASTSARYRSVLPSSPARFCTPLCPTRGEMLLFFSRLRMDRGVPAAWNGGLRNSDEHSRLDKQADGRQSGGGGDGTRNALPPQTSELTAVEVVS